MRIRIVLRLAEVKVYSLKLGIVFSVARHPNVICSYTIFGSNQAYSFFFMGLQGKEGNHINQYSM